MLPLLAEIREAVSVPVAALPVPTARSEQQPSFQSLEDPTGTTSPGPAVSDRARPLHLHPLRDRGLRHRRTELGVGYPAFAAARRRTTSAPWPRPSVAPATRQPLYSGHDQHAYLESDARFGTSTASTSSGSSGPIEVSGRVTEPCAWRWRSSTVCSGRRRQHSPDARAARACASRGRRSGRLSRARAHGLLAGKSERRRARSLDEPEITAWPRARRDRLRRRLRRGRPGAHLQQRRLHGRRRRPARAPKLYLPDLRHLGGAQALHAETRCAPSTRTSPGGSPSGPVRRLATGARGPRCPGRRSRTDRSRQQHGPASGNRGRVGATSIASTPGCSSAS